MAPGKSGLRRRRAEAKWVSWKRWKRRLSYRGLFLSSSSWRLLSWASCEHATMYLQGDGGIRLLYQRYILYKESPVHVSLSPLTAYSSLCTSNVYNKQQPAGGGNELILPCLWHSSLIFIFQKHLFSQKSHILFQASLLLVKFCLWMISRIISILDFWPILKCKW